MVETKKSHETTTETSRYFKIGAFHPLWFDKKNNNKNLRTGLFFTKETWNLGSSCTNVCLVRKCSNCSTVTPNLQCQKSRDSLIFFVKELAMKGFAVLVQFILSSDNLCRKTVSRQSRLCKKKRKTNHHISRRHKPQVLKLKKTCFFWKIVHTLIFMELLWKWLENVPKYSYQMVIQ